MSGADLLIGIATIAVAVAGFTGLAASLVSAGTPWTHGQRLRLRIIVSSSFSVMFESLLPPTLFAVSSDSRTSIVVASAAAGIYALVLTVGRGRQLAGAHVLPNRSVQLGLLAATSATALFLCDVVLGSLTVYVFALGIQLSVAAISFYSLVAPATS